MNITLSPELAELVQQKIKSGLYQSPDEMVAKALKLLDKYDEKLAALRKDIQVGLEQIERGEYTEYTDATLHELVDKITQRGRKWLESNRPEPDA